MNERVKSVMVGMALGAVVGALFGWMSGDAKQNRLPGQRVGLQAIAPSDYMKIGVAVLTLAREFRQMMNKQ